MRSLKTVLAWAIISASMAMPAAAQLGGAPITTEEADSTTTSAEDEPTVPRLVVRVNPQAIWEGRNTLTDSVLLNLNHTGRWDEADTLPGFTYRLGQVGKPLLNYQYGLPASRMVADQGLDNYGEETPLYGVGALAGLPYLDTRTPYIRGEFTQSAREIQLLGVTVSRNITPYFNTTLYYKRRTGLGAYNRFQTSHTNLGISQNLRTPSNSLQVAWGYAFSQLSDNLHGGVVFNDSTNIFQKDQQPILLNEARLFRRSNRIEGQALLRLAGKGQGRGELTVMARGGVGWYARQYRDEGTTGLAAPYELSSTSNDTAYRPYGTLFTNGDTLDRFSWGYSSRWGYGQAGLRQVLRTPILRLSHQADIRLERTATGDSQTVNQTTTQLTYRLRLENPDSLLRWWLSGQVSYQVSELLDPEQRVQASAGWQARPRPFELPDSSWLLKRRRLTRRYAPYVGVRIPWRVEAHVLAFNRNPTLREAFTEAPTVRPLNAPANELLLHARLAGTWQGPPRTARGYPYLPDYARLTLFASTQIDPLLADSGAQPTQQVGNSLTWLGGTLAGRIHYKRLYLEADATWQQGAGTNGLTDAWAAAQPAGYGNLRIFFENKVFKEGTTVLRLALELGAFSEYQGLFHDASLGVWYPQVAFALPAYVRVDALAAARFGTAEVFVKLIHLNEGITADGYFTTPLYPMLERTFSFGVNWSFFN